MGAQVDLQNPTNKFTALHYAIMESNGGGIKVLIDNGAKTDIRNCDVCFLVFFLIICFRCLQFELIFLRF